MATFAPVYWPAASQQSFLTRAQKRERKRKRDGTSDGGNADEQDSQPADDQVLPDVDEEPRVLHPVNKTDPYYVAGHAREKPLPGGNFPHAALKPARTSEAYKDANRPVEEELAELNPPLYIPKRTVDDPTTSLRRRHLDNLAALLHKCMLNADWTRASRVWGLILRTEIQGYGPDIRQNGRWMIGAELLMRRGQDSKQQQQQQHAAPSAISDNVSDQQGESAETHPMISDEGFQLARDYYQRLALQYPHHTRAHHSLVTALAIYPALFSVWIYEVQDRAKRARDNVKIESKSPQASEIGSPGYEQRSDKAERARIVQSITTKTLEDATAVEQRLDELMLNPPYDVSNELFHIQGMLSLWVSDLHKELSGDPSDHDLSRRHHNHQATLSREKAKTTFKKLILAKVELSDQIQAFLQDEGEEVSLDDAS